MPLRPGARVVDGRDEAGRVDELDHRGTERGRGAMSHTHPEAGAPRAAWNWSSRDARWCSNLTTG
jgi:hypothetical protein